MNWTTDKVRQTWLDYFAKKDHLVLASKSLIPINDPSLLWINSGVATLKDYFSARKTPPSKRLVNAQICLRVNDIENVGFTSRHQTLFEMLGNFSIGDYFKTEAIDFAFDLLVNYYQLDPKRFYITVYEDDETTYKRWIKHKIDKNHIIKCDKSRNFWDLGLGPCGPCTEIYYDRGEKFDPKKIGEKLFFEDIENDRYVEIWNIVFSQFNNDGNGNYTELAQKNIDTGAGIERLVSVLQNSPTNFDTDIFLKLIKIIEAFCPFKYDPNSYFTFDPQKVKEQSYFRIIADHFKAITFTISEGVLPGPNERNYVVRRLLRRALIACKKLQLNLAFIEKIIDEIIASYENYYQHLKAKNETVKQVVLKEINAFNKTIDLGLVLFEKSVKNNTLTPQLAFQLNETYGFPVEIIRELVNQKGLTIDWTVFDQLMAKHRSISKQNNQTINFEKQNINLVNFKTKSTFFYHKNKINAKVIGLFDENYLPVKELNNQSGYVVFDQTVLYATSGGQRYDEGSCINHSNNNDQKISFQGVFKGPNKQHFHYFLVGSFKLNDQVTLSHDETWRKLAANNHSLEHLLHAALQKEIDPLIKQSGAFKSAQKATIDFNLNRHLTRNELEKVENKIRSLIKQKISSEEIFTDFEGSQKLNAIAYFEEEYSQHEILRVIRFGDYSVELCGGTHVANTASIEDCFITDFYSLGAGKWRIEIISSNETINNYLKAENQKLIQLKSELEKVLSLIDSSIFKVELKELQQRLDKFILPEKITQLRDASDTLLALKNDINQLKTKNYKVSQQALALSIKKQLLSLVDENKSYVIATFNDVEPKLLLQTLHDVFNQNQTKNFLIINQFNESNSFIVIGNKTTTIIEKLRNSFNLKGGGNDKLFRGSFQDNVTPQKLNELFQNK